MKEFKELIKKHKKIELSIKHFTKLRKLKKEKLKLKELFSKFKK